ncbi:MAG TPA: amidohydrolase family protein [Roseiarcus sp.]|nr:amidohydrolase family protein [Roseiarcus sp.]
MCSPCDAVAHGGAAQSVSPVFAAAAPDADRRSAAPANLETHYAAAASAMPEGVGVKGRKTLIKGGVVLSMDDRVGNHARGDVLIDGATILDVAAAIDAPDAAVIDASGCVVIPGFIDGHHHQFETALRSFLADAILINDGRPESVHNYYEFILQKLSLGYRPRDVYINELFGGIAQIDAGVTGVMDVSQIHHSPEHTDAAIEGLKAAGRRAVLGYFEGWGDKAKYPGDASRVREQHFAASDQLLSMFMGGEIYLPGYEEAWRVGRELDLPIALHVVGTFGMQPTFDALAAAGKFGSDCFFIHMTGMSEVGWRAAADAGAHVSISAPIEMHMRHGMPPIQKALDLGVSLSLSSDVECTMAADMFTQMRSVLTLQRMLANELALQGKDYPKLMSVADVLSLATIGGARGLKIDRRTGSLTPGKDADIVLLDATALNVAPLNHATGAVVTLMDRSNVSTVICAGQIKKWRGALVGYDIAKLSSELEASRDHVFAAAGVERDLFRA